MGPISPSASPTKKGFRLLASAGRSWATRNKGNEIFLAESITMDEDKFNNRSGNIGRFRGS